LIREIICSQKRISQFYGSDGKWEESSASYNGSNFRNGSNWLGIFIKKIIDTLTGQPGRRAAESPTSVTQDLQAFRILDHARYESRIVLVDTPGFDHSSKTKEEILKLIREWLEKTYVELDLRDPYYHDNHICADARNE
jgi:hypothetical protein